MASTERPEDEFLFGHDLIPDTITHTLGPEYIVSSGVLVEGWSCTQTSAGVLTDVTSLLLKWVYLSSHIIRFDLSPIQTTLAVI